MKKIILLLSILQLTAVAQNWNVFNKNYRYNYIYDNSPVITNVLFVTSTVQASADTVYNLNLIGTSCLNGCPTITAAVGGSVVNVPNNQIIIPYQPQFLQRKIRKYATGNVLLYDTANFFVQPKCMLNQSWLFDNVSMKNATCTAVGTQSLFGVMDSVKTIIIGVNDTLKLSKSFGIIQFPQPYNLNKYYRLVGIENASSYDVNALYGLKVPNFWDMYNFNIGDQLYMKEDHCNYATLPQSTYGNIKMFKITGKQSAATGYTYQVNGYVKSYYSTNNCTTPYQNIAPLNPVYYSPGNFTPPPENIFYPGSIIATGGNGNYSVISGSTALSPYGGRNNICRLVKNANNKLSKQAGVFGCYTYTIGTTFGADTFSTLIETVVNNKSYLVPSYNSMSCRFISTEGRGTIVGDYCWFEHFNTSCLLSMVQGNDTLYGPMPDLGVFAGIKEFSSKPGAWLYPNPASQTFNIGLPEPLSVSVYDNTGRQVLSIEKENELDVSGLSPGLYLVRVTTRDKIFTEKLLVER